MIQLVSHKRDWYGTAFIKLNLSVDGSKGGIFVVYKKIEIDAFQPNFSIEDMPKLFFPTTSALLLPRLHWEKLFLFQTLYSVIF